MDEWTNERTNERTNGPNACRVNMDETRPWRRVGAEVEARRGVAGVESLEAAAEEARASVAATLLTALLEVGGGGVGGGGAS